MQHLGRFASRTSKAPTRTELTAKIDEQRTELTAKIDEQRTELRGKIDRLRSDQHSKFRWVTGLIVVSILLPFAGRFAVH